MCWLHCSPVQVALSLKSTRLDEFEECRSVDDIAQRRSEIRRKFELKTRPVRAGIEGRIQMAEITNLKKRLNPTIQVMI